jgi:hypothetical protein
VNTHQDPELYAKMSEPYASEAEARAAIEAFIHDVRSSRIRNRIACAYLVASAPLTGSDTPWTFGTMGVGDSEMVPLLLGFAIGSERLLHAYKFKAEYDRGERLGHDSTLALLKPHDAPSMARLLRLLVASALRTDADASVPGFGLKVTLSISPALRKKFGKRATKGWEQVGAESDTEQWMAPAWSLLKLADELEAAESEGEEA